MALSQSVGEMYQRAKREAGNFAADLQKDMPPLGLTALTAGLAGSGFVLMLYGYYVSGTLALVSSYLPCYVAGGKFIEKKYEQNAQMERSGPCSSA